MNELKARLTKELQQDFNVKIMGSLSWSLPIHSIEVEFNTAKRTTMDILMKMMLITFRKVEIETAQELSEILLVEQLFINDLIDKMSRTGVIEKKEGFFSLTDTGVEQLERGVFEHEPEIDSTRILYSPSHQAFLNGDIKNSSHKEQEMYRYQVEFDDKGAASLEDSVIVDALKTIGIESNEGNVQVVVSEIISASSNEIEWAPCLEFHLYNKAEDIMYARVWNTLTEHWDETLEAQLNEKERKKWRETYL
ncbi:hypothetical protein FITA111629_08380 [Filibacter tadaridae]|uniref:Uncharacterized protein n=1 Tax=Filibacter tadaridae TaxID=2483811 RepID=A0A3P5WVY9_9BACL|nr:hypothetical protein [Filibacter tadaridae]VDC25955.1 hypothetical protein FILTAD_01381 [Filibacter tadaridae]